MQGMGGADVLFEHDDCARGSSNGVLFDLWKVEINGLLIRDALVLGIFHAADNGRTPGVNPSAEVGVRHERGLMYYCEGGIKPLLITG
jgi:hypothetical protein